MAHHRLVVHVLPHIHRKVVVPLHHQRPVERPDGGAGDHVELHAQLPGGPPDADLIGAPGAAAAEHQPCSAHILSPCLCFLSVSPGRYATPRYSSSVSPGSAMIASATSLPT